MSELDVIRELHAVFDAAGVSNAEGETCNDPECQTLCGHRARTLVAERDRLKAENDALKAALHAEAGDHYASMCRFVGDLRIENARLRADLLEMAEKYARQSAALGQAAERRGV